MAKDDNRTLRSEERVDTVFYDKYDNEVLRLGFRTREYEEDGTDTTERTIQHRELGDNNLYTAALAMRHGKDRELLVTCDACCEEAESVLFRRNPSGMTLVLASKSHRCGRCRRNLCSRHYVINSEGQFLCRRCNRFRFFVHGILKRIFFRLL